MVIEPGRARTRVPQPDSNSYLLSEDTELELRLLVDALRAAATLCDAFDEDVSEIAPREIGALFHVMGEHAATLAAETRFVITSRGAA